ncbi:MAG: type IV pilus assembly protein PilM [Patescibacteria group bacterium]|nr:type IV pilus assembly protein PilM [Patescibacteria group bacterium]
MFNLFLKPQKAFGLDISGSSLKVMQLENKKSEVSVDGYTDTPLPKGLMTNDVILDGKTFGYLVRQSLQKPLFGKIDRHYVVASLPESKSFVRVIQIPKMSDGEAENAIPVEAESFIPLPIDQVYLDWQKLGETEGKMNILIIASPKEFVDKYLEILDQAGLKPIALEVESQSCRRALLEPASKETLLMIDLDAYRTSMAMVEEGNLQFTSTVPIAGDSFTESIAKSLGVSSAKAEEIKKKVGIANTVQYPNIKTALLPTLNNLSAEIKSILKFHGEHSGRKVDKILLSGGSAKLKNLAEFLAPQLNDFSGIPVETGNPWLNLKTLRSKPLEAYDSLGYVTAIGLAIRGMDA